MHLFNEDGIIGRMGDMETTRREGDDTPGEA